MIKIREEGPEDAHAVREVHIQAFGQALEADLVDTLRQGCDDLLAMAPMAVLPEYQRQGIGTQLVQAGIEALKQVECPFIILVGHAAYYPRFGFEPASQYGIRSEWEVPDDAFMVLVLNEQQRDGLSGVATYRPEFSEAE